VLKSLAFPVNVFVNGLPLERIAEQAHNHRANVMSDELTQQLPNDLLRQILARLDSVDARLTALEEKVDRRLQETRPIWESVLEQLKEVNARLDRTETRLDRIEKEFIAMRRWARYTFAEMSIEHGNLEERVDKIEERLTSTETPTT